MFLHNFRRKRRILLRFAGTLRVSGNSEEAGMSTYVCILRLSPVGQFLRSAKATVCGFPRCSTCRSSWTSTASAWLSFQVSIFSFFFSSCSRLARRERIPTSTAPRCGSARYTTANSRRSAGGIARSAWFGPFRPARCDGYLLSGTLQPVKIGGPR